VRRAFDNERPVMTRGEIAPDLHYAGKTRSE
jgi:hypothetical protein